jgi:hypothetical protein
VKTHQHPHQPTVPMHPLHPQHQVPQQKGPQPKGGIRHYLLMEGQHIGSGPDGTDRYYLPGEVVASPLDLTTLNHQGGGSPKFVETSGPASVGHRVNE